MINNKYVIGTLFYAIIRTTACEHQNIVISLQHFLPPL